MKRILLVLPAFLATTFGFSQGQIENPGFEGAWDDILGTEHEPEDWSSLKTADALTLFAPEVAFQTTTDPHSGTYCIRLEAISVPPVANGLLTNGRVHASWTPSDGYVYTIDGNDDFSHGFTDRPDSLTFWVKHAPTSNDKSKVEVILHNDATNTEGRLPHDGNYSHWVGKSRADVTGTISTWQRVSVPFVYFNTGTPEYLLITCAAGDSTIAQAGTQMWLDDFLLIYNPLSVSIDPPGQQNIDACVNGTTLTVTENANAAVITTPTREWKWSTTSGSGYQSFTTPETGTTYTPNFSTVDTYYIICETDFGAQGVITSNEVEIVVTASAGNVVSVTPVTQQNINENQAGNILTAVECPTSSSREWKWTTTSGSGYQSFTSVETGSSYTPLFASSGTYYVVCESDFAGDIQVSNEVTIIVDLEGTGINELGISLNVYNVGSAIQVNYQSAINEARLEVFTMDGKSVYNSNITNGVSTHEINSASGFYIYRVIEGDKILTGKIKM